MVKVYKNQMNEQDRILFLDFFKNCPDKFWTQSDCTDEEVVQLKDFMPFIIKFKLLTMHNNMLLTIMRDFDLRKKKIKLTHPGFLTIGIENTLTIDKRVVGNALSPHADTPTGTYEKEKGEFFEDGTSPIAMSCVYYYNDDFDGGELDLYFDINAKDLTENNNKYDFDQISPSYTYKPVAGDLIVFPSNIVHAIRPVTSGVRYSSQYFYRRLQN